MMSIPGQLNRSYSESELYRLNLENLCIQDRSIPTYLKNNVPVVKKTVLIVEEIYPNFSIMSRCGQSIPNRLDDVGRIQSSTLSMSSPVKSKYLDTRLNSQVQQKSNQMNDDCDEIVPMDVDTVCDNLETEECLLITEKMDVDMNYLNDNMKRLTNLEAILKKRKLKTEPVFPEKASLMNNTQINPILSKKKNFRHSSIIVILISLMFLLYFCVWFFQVGILYVNSDVQLQNLQKDFLEEVYDQKGPINIIIQSLEHRKYWINKIKVVAFIGSAGVGKTFITNILKKHFYSELVHEIYGNQFNIKSQWDKIISRLKSCCLNLIIIDDLDKKEIITFFEFVHFLPENHFILIVPVFSIQHSDDKLNYVIDYDDINEIRQEFNDSNLFYELAVFHQFTMHQVKDWLKKQMKIQNIKYSEKLINNILNNHNASYEGLKGLHAKLLLEQMDNLI